MHAATWRRPADASAAAVTGVNPYCSLSCFRGGLLNSHMPSLASTAVTVANRAAAASRPRTGVGFIAESFKLNDIHGSRRFAEALRALTDIDSERRHFG